MVELRYNRSGSVRILYLGICQIMNAMKMSVYYISDSVKNQDITAKKCLDTISLLMSDITAMLESRYYSKNNVRILHQW